MARTALEHALPAGWVDEVFDEHRERQYSRELLFSTVVELVTLVSLGLRPSLHAAARTMTTLPVTLAARYDKVNRTEPAILRALVRGSAERLAPVAAAVDGGTILPGWRLRVLDGNHLPASEKRLAPLRGHRGAALPGQTLVVYDPDSGLVTDIVASEDAHQSERASVAPLLDSAQPGQLWIADRHFCTRVIMQGWDEAHAGFIVREHACHPRLVGQGDWHGCGRTGTGEVREQAIEVAGARWRRIELALDKPTEAGERVIRLWSNLPEEISAARIAELYRTRWRIDIDQSWCLSRIKRWMVWTGSAAFRVKPDCRGNPIVAEQRVSTPFECECISEVPTCALIAGNTSRDVLQSGVARDGGRCARLSGRLLSRDRQRQAPPGRRSCPDRPQLGDRGGIGGHQLGKAAAGRNRAAA